MLFPGGHPWGVIVAAALAQTAVLQGSVARSARCDYKVKVERRPFG